MMLFNLLLVSSSAVCCDYVVSITDFYLCIELKFEVKYDSFLYNRSVAPYVLILEKKPPFVVLLGFTTNLLGFHTFKAFPLFFKHIVWKMSIEGSFELQTKRCIINTEL